MKIVRKAEAKEYRSSANCCGLEFDLGTKDLDGALVKVRGRYPDKGRVRNEVCKLIAFIIDGEGQVIIEGNKFEVKSEDLIVLDKGERYYWNGNFKLFIYCTPVWYPEQHKEVE